MPTPRDALTTDHHWTFSPDNRFVAGTGTESQGNAFVTVFDATTGATVGDAARRAPHRAHHESSRRAPPGGPRAGHHRRRRMEHPRRKQAARNRKLPAQGSTSVMAFSPDSSSIAEGINGIRIYEVETGTLRQALPAHTNPLLTALDPTFHPYAGVGSLAFSATGQLASAGSDGTVRFWCSP